MSAVNFEAFLVRLYVDPETRTRFLADPHSEMQTAGLTEEERKALVNIDRVGLTFAARSFARKRTMRESPHGKRSWAKHWAQMLTGYQS